jgi:hypothetical protein
VLEDQFSAHYPLLLFPNEQIVSIHLFFYKIEIRE